MNKVIAGILLTIIIIANIVAFYYAGKGQHEAECIERAKIMQQWDETTKAIICGTGECKTE